MNRRRLLAAVWIAGATVPLLLATVFFVGCCALPFHRVAHKVLMPICHFAMSIMPADDLAESDALPPAREQQEPVRRIATQVPRVFRLAAIETPARSIAPGAATEYRSFISLGAIRCDRDVGLHLLDETFLI